jgi:DNA-binding NtrC family response regulator
MGGSRHIIAIVDDEVDLANLFADVLNSEGFEAITFSDPLSAIGHLNSHHHDFSMVITDWRMPSMNGLELAKLVQQMDKEIKIVVMSAFELDKDELNEINKEDYLRKPMHVSKLIESVKKLLIEPQIMGRPTSNFNIRQFI